MHPPRDPRCRACTGTGVCEELEHGTDGTDDFRVDDVLD